MRYAALAGAQKRDFLLCQMYAVREIEKESRDILMEAAKHSPELAIALETWKEIKFEFDTVDKLDVQG